MSKLLLFLSEKRYKNFGVPLVQFTIISSFRIRINHASQRAAFFIENNQTLQFPAFESDNQTNDFAVLTNMLDSDICRYTSSVTDIFANKTGSLPEKRLFPRPAPSSSRLRRENKKKLQISTGTRRAHPPEIQITTINHCFYHPFGRRRALAVVCLLSFRFISEISFLSPPRDGPSS